MCVFEQRKTHCAVWSIIKYCICLQSLPQCAAEISYAFKPAIQQSTTSTVPHLLGEWINAHRHEFNELCEREINLLCSSTVRSPRLLFYFLDQLVTRSST